MSRWGGSDSRRARAVCEPLVAAGVRCYRCRKPIRPGQAWHADHVVPRHAGGGDDPSNLWPSHDGCNTSDGGKVGARITNSRRQYISQPRRAGRTAMAAEAVRGIRGV